MFLKKLFKFNKDFSHYLEKGDGYFADERYSDAREAYEDALAKLGDTDSDLAESIRSKYCETGNRLALLNISEAGHALQRGDMKKAEEHLQLVFNLASDGSVIKKAEDLIAEFNRAETGGMAAEPAHSCDGCKNGDIAEESDGEFAMEGLGTEDRLSLYYHSLPEDLPERYAAMGDQFARGCLLNLEGDPDGALGIFEELSADGCNDILDYEKAIIYYHKGDQALCETLLKRGLECNDLNPLCCLGLIHLYTDTGRASEALPVVRGMIDRGVITDQARFMEGEIFLMLQDEPKAMESFSQLLTSAGFAKDAAGRLIPLLEKHGKLEEAGYLAKRFAKGCH